MMDQLIRHLKSSQNILVATHILPDGDAIGSLLAMGLFLESVNKKTTFYDESPIPAVYRFLPGVGKIVRRIASTADFDTAVILDCGDFQRVGRLTPRLEGGPVIINIDHHVTNTGFGDFQWIDTEACATVEIIYNLISDMGGAVTKDIATSIYTGILTDTGSFRFSNTNQASFKICSDMIERGVDPYDIAQHVYGTYSLARLKLLNLALETIEVSDNGKVSVMTLTNEMLHETGTRPEDADGLINYARNIEDVKVAALIQEHRNGRWKTKDQVVPFHVSLRSDGTVDVAAIASSFGGGGHISAAGFSIETTLGDLKAKIINLAKGL